jgi:hypothetical protein
MMGTNSQAQNTNQSGSPTTSGYLDTTNQSYQIFSQPEYVGGYDITPNFTVMLQTKPMWLHRYMTRILLGWKWKDTK